MSTAPRLRAVHRRAKLARHIVPLTQYYKDLANGTPQAVAHRPSGASGAPAGRHPVRRSAVKDADQQPDGESVLVELGFLLLAYDDWGGWYDRQPPRVDAFGYGFRAPALLVSPYAQGLRGPTLEFGSGLKFIEENWGLAPLTRRDANAKSLSSAFDFKAPPQPARIIPAERNVTSVASGSIIYPAYGLGAAVVLLP